MELRPESQNPITSMNPASPAWHQPVMSAEVMRHLNPRAGAVIVDATAGTGGHSFAIAPHVLPTGRLIALDRDRQSLEVAAGRLKEFEPQAGCVHGNYRDLPDILQRLGIPAIDGLLLDLGMSSPQVDRAERGFSFLREGPLDMRMDAGQDMTAEALVNELSADELAMLFETLGEERFAARIARRIADERRTRRFTSTVQLAQAIAQAVPGSARHGRLHPATRVFQALRMAVNDEVGALGELLSALPALLRPGGRAVILTYHSLEDRPVKRAFAQGKQSGLWRVLTKKPLCATEDEVAANPRARSAKLRAIERLGAA